MEDRLSDLADDIISQILVHLTTIEVFRTQILSRRWNTAWESVTVLSFSSTSFRSRDEYIPYLCCSSFSHRIVRPRFSSFIDRVLVARNSYRLDEFSISSHRCVSASVMISWIRAAIDRRVTKLVITFSPPKEEPSEINEFTHDMIASDYLTFLKLNSLAILYINPKTASSFLPNLKILKLCCVIYKDELSLPNLLSGCPNLEELFISGPQWHIKGSSQTLTIKSRSLKTLSVLTSINDVKIISIDTPALESILVSCMSIVEFVVKELPCLVEAKVELRWLPETLFDKFITSVSHAKSINLNPRVFW